MWGERFLKFRCLRVLCSLTPAGSNYLLTSSSRNWKLYWKNEMSESLALCEMNGRISVRWRRFSHWMYASSINLPDAWCFSNRLIVMNTAHRLWSDRISDLQGQWSLYDVKLVCKRSADGLYSEEGRRQVPCEEVPLPHHYPSLCVPPLLRNTPPSPPSTSPTHRGLSGL